VVDRRIREQSALARKSISVFLPGALLNIAELGPLSCLVYHIIQSSITYDWIGIKRR
jgi:hypothetical protein